MAKVFDVAGQGGGDLRTAGSGGIINSTAPALYSENAFDSVSGEASTSFEKLKDGTGWAYDSFCALMNTSFTKYAHKSISGLTTQFSGRVCVRYETINNNVTYPIVEHYVSGAGTGYFKINMNYNGGTYQITGWARDNGNAYAQVGSGIAISLNTWYQIIYRFKQNTANGAEFEIWSEDGQTQVGTTQTASFTTYNGSSTPDYRVGKMINTGSYDRFRLSRMALWDDYTLPAKLSAQVNTWQGTTTSWNTAGNWSLGHVPTSTEIAEFSSGSQGCTLDVAAVCRVLRFTSGYSGNFNQNGYSLTIDGQIDFKGTGTFTGDNSVISVAGNIYFDSAMNTLSLDGAEFQQTYSGHWYWSQAVDSGDRVKLVTVSNNCRLYSQCSIALNHTSTSLTLNNSNCLLYLLSTGWTFYHSGTIKPLEDSGATIAAATGYSIVFSPSGSTNSISLPKINSGMNLLLTLNQPGASKSCTYTMTADITCRQLTVGSNANYTNNVTLKTDGYNATIGVVVFNSISTTAGNASYFHFDLTGSGGRTTTFNHGGYSGSPWSPVVSANSTLEMTLSNATWNIGLTTADMSLAVTGTFTLNRGTSLTVMSATASRTFTSAGKQFYNVQVNMNHATYSWGFADALNCYNLKIEPNSIVLFKEGVTHTIATYNSHDWDGTSGNLVTINSVTAGQQHTLANPVSMGTLQYMKVKDSVANNTIIVNDGTSTDQGNNSGWNFSAVNWFLLNMKNQLAYPNNY